MPYEKAQASECNMQESCLQRIHWVLVVLTDMQQAVVHTFMSSAAKHGSAQLSKLFGLASSCQQIRGTVPIK